MTCAAGELCHLAGVEMIAPNGHPCGHDCRGECGGKLHGICGEVEDPDDTPTHRICQTCISKRRLSNPPKRKQGHGLLQRGFLQPGPSKASKTNAGGKKPRKRLDLGQKLEILDLLDSKVTYAEIKRRYSCGDTQIGTVRSDKEALRAAAASNSRSASSKTARGGDYPEVCVCVWIFLLPFFLSTCSQPTCSTAVDTASFFSVFQNE